MTSNRKEKPLLVYEISVEEIVDAVGQAEKLSRDLFYSVTRNGEGHGKRERSF
jgi:hypothetical protein